MLLLLLLLVPLARAAPLELASPATRATLVELYTSEGCSSCPPADRWFSRLRDDPRLWREIVPVAFHVDYWNHLGWTDRFASATHSRRQRSYVDAGQVSTVYTPGFVVAGQEWRGWFQGREPEFEPDREAGVLTLRIADGVVDARFVPRGAAAGAGRLELHVALLGFGLETAVQSGENAGRSLRHDFVVLDHARVPLEAREQGHSARFDWSPRVAPGGRRAVAAWVSPRDAPVPLQAVGGWWPGTMPGG
ncbi:MAG: DUF1223 domain-containing protein [Gammaproteobacteria bacterium]|nr:DUF1223 domain-containing protein [Gammaproteobacteria bacterium]